MGNFNNPGQGGGKQQQTPGQQRPDQQKQRQDQNKQGQRNPYEQGNNDQNKR